MIGYAVVAGLVPSDVLVPIVGVKIILFRGLCAFFIMFFTITALSLFNIEQRELIREQLQRFSQSEKLTSMGYPGGGDRPRDQHPLTNISLNIEMLKDLVGDDGRVGRKIAAIERNIDRASRIARELLHFSREKEAALEPISINQVLTSALNLLQHQQLSSIVHLNLRDVPAVMGIPWKLEEVFVNLLMNSLDACGEGNRIEVTTSCAGNRVVVVIADTGHGIDQEQLGKGVRSVFHHQGNRQGHRPGAFGVS